MHKEAVGVITPLEDEAQTVVALTLFLSSIESGQFIQMTPQRISSFERAHAVSTLATLFDAVILPVSAYPCLKS